MKNLIQTPTFQSKIEFWAAITIFSFAVLSLISGAESPYRYQFEEAGVHFYYYRSNFTPQLVKFCLLFVAFLFLNFHLVPKLLAKEQVMQNISFLVVIFFVVGMVFGVTDTYRKAYLFAHYRTEDDMYEAVFRDSFRHTFWLLMLLGFYSFIKYVSTYLLTNSEAIQNKYKVISRDALAAFVVWLVSMFLLVIAMAEQEFIIGWGVIGPFSILLYSFSFYYLIPKAVTRKKPMWSFILYCIGTLLLTYLPVVCLLLLFVHHPHGAFILALMNGVFQLLITVPATWMLYKKQTKGNQELFVLKKELGTSNATLDFLRSQINPHFLFNALNTLYGTALQENSERTAKGIQMLGDMMRFMLHENLQEKILLSREVDYLRNYIDLQLLRISSSPNIDIQIKLEEVVEDKMIAPMLLIPFVENAFKHGISLKNQSWIKVTLHTELNNVYFDIYNSKHSKLEQDPEKDKSGVGLQNVKQRLELLYPKRFELIIRDTQEEYFVHLTLKL